MCVGSHFVGLEKLRRQPSRMLLLIAPQIVSECRLLSSLTVLQQVKVARDTRYI